MQSVFTYPAFGRYGNMGTMTWVVFLKTWYTREKFQHNYDNIFPYFTRLTSCSIGRDAVSEETFVQFGAAIAATGDCVLRAG